MINTPHPLPGEPLDQVPLLCNGGKHPIQTTEYFAKSETLINLRYFCNPASHVYILDQMG